MSAAKPEMRSETRPERDGPQPPLHPLVEGMNMGVWIGFKHVNYLMEHGIGRFLRDRGAGIRSLYWGDGVCVAFTASEVRYEVALTIDEPVSVLVRPKAHGAGAVEFDVVLVSDRFGAEVRMAHGRYRAAFLDRAGATLAERPSRIEAVLAEES